MRETGNRERSSDYYVLLGEWHGRRGDSEAAPARPGPRGRAGDREQGPRRHACAPASREPRPSRAAPRRPPCAWRCGRPRRWATPCCASAPRRPWPGPSSAAAACARPRNPPGARSRWPRLAGGKPACIALHALLGRILEKKGEAAAAAAAIPRERPPDREAQGRARHGPRELLRRAPRGAGGRSLERRASCRPGAERSRRNAKGSGAAGWTLTAPIPGRERTPCGRSRRRWPGSPLRTRVCCSASARARSGSASSPGGSCASRRPSAAESPASSMTGSASR